MGTDKRQRQKEGRAVRIAAAEAAQRRADQRSLVLRALGVLALVGLAVGALFVFANSDDEDSTETADASTTTTFPTDFTTLPPLESAAGKPCVAPVSPPAAGEPAVPVVEGEPPTELVIEDLAVGDGEEITDPAQTVTVNYVGVACSTGETFDSSFARGEPIDFPLNGVIAGWTQGLLGMKVGGQRLLGIPSELGYGAAGSPPSIAPDEALWFVVELEAIGAATDPAATDPAATDPAATEPAATDPAGAAAGDTSTTETAAP